MSIWRFHVCFFFIDCIFMIFLKSDSLNANPESRALLAPNKAPWDGIDAQVKVVYYSSLQWTVDTSHRNIDSERELQRYIFFSIAHSAMQFGEAAYHLWCKVTAKWPTQQCVLPIMNQTAFQFGHIYIYIYIYILFLSYLCLNCV